MPAEKNINKWPRLIWIYWSVIVPNTNKMIKYSTIYLALSSMSWNILLMVNSVNYALKQLLQIKRIYFFIVTIVFGLYTYNIIPNNF